MMTTTTTSPVIIADGILIEREHLKREGLVNRIVAEQHEGKRHVVLGSPPATGKTALLQLIESAFSRGDQSVNTVKIPVTKYMSPEYIMNELDRKGISQQTDRLAQLENTLLLIDDAQNAYGEEYDGVWQFVVKTLRNAKIKGHLFIVIATTYYIEVAGSPVVFKALPHFPSGLKGDETIALASEEADHLFSMHASRWGYGSWLQLRDTLKELSGCHIGVIVRGLSMLENVYKSNERNSFSEEKAIDKLRDDEFLDTLSRCFSLPLQTEENKVIFQRAIINALLGTSEKDMTEDPLLGQLVRGGILTKTGDFTCKVVSWYYNRKFFPNRASRAPNSLDDLVVSSVRRISASRLRGAIDKGFPKEAAFQHLFNEAMSINLPHTCRVIPELNTKATRASGKKQTDELDFYVNGELQWAVELLRNGDMISEHIKHFHKLIGKYREVPQRDYLVVDCRPPKTRAVTALPDRCTLYFAVDFAKCICKMRLKDEFEIELMP